MKKDLLKEVKLLSKRETSRALARMQREQEKSQKDLEARAKPIYELTHEELFEVESVVQESYEHIVSPMSEWRAGSSSDGYTAGYSTLTRLTVKPIDSRIPITSIEFKGPTSVKAGDAIHAVISRHETHEGDRNFDDYTPRNILYTDREYRPNEEAIEIKILSAVFKKVVRTERSVNYNEFKKE